MTQIITSSLFSQVPAPSPKPGFIFSQSSLQDIADCRRRFYLRYLLRLSWPAVEGEPVSETENLMLVGARFHNLAHQYYLGVPHERLNNTAQTEPLATWWINFLNEQKTNKLFTQSDTKYWPEYSRIISLGKYRLMAKYDLLITSTDEVAGKSFIVDWKTSTIRTKRAYLERRLQTVVYPFVLYKSQLRNQKSPSLEMMYWFANFPETPEIFEYDLIKHEDALSKIHTLIELVAPTTDTIKSVDEQYPLTESEQVCRFCVYRSLCNRGISAANILQTEGRDYEAENHFDTFYSLDEIEEIEY